MPASPVGPGGRYPALRPFTPVLTPAPGMVQIGLDQEPSVVLADVPAGLPRLLALLDGCHSRPAIYRAGDALGVERSVLDWTLRTLDAAGLLLEDPPPPAPGTELSDRQIRLVGAGRLGRAVAALLVESGIGVLYLADDAPPDLSLYPRAAALGSQAQALRSWLGGRAHSCVRVVNHWSKPDAVAPELTILAADVLECDRVVVEHLMRTDQPHLVLRPRAGGVVVGPLILPGRTACLRCTDLTRRDADPHWPALLPRLQRTSMAVTVALAGWAGAVATTQALSFLAGFVPETCGGTLEMSPVDHLTSRRSWAMHPGCGCGWQATAQWGA